MTTTESGNISFESRAGTFALEFGGRSGTPLVEIPVINNQVIKVTAQFNASNGSAKGFYYDIESLDSDIKPLTPTSGVTQNITGWADCTRVAFFNVNKPDGGSYHDPLTDAQFQVVFNEGDLGGEGQRLNNFVLIAELVGTYYFY